MHFVWKFRLYSIPAETTDGEIIDILQPGRHNTDSGPDFSDARIKLGNTTWAGNIEIHMKSSGWYEHKHQHDPAYANIILHVVFENDRDIFDRNGNTVPAMELKGKIHSGVYKKYFYFLNNQLWIPCEHDVVSVDPVTMKSWMERLFVERMERKLDGLRILYQRNKNSLTETFYQLLAGNFGFKTNEQPFQLLSRMLPLSVPGKHKNSLFQVEAMLFGCAGLLTGDFKDDYPNQLKQEFSFLQKKYGLAMMEGHLWKFLRLRPANFPTIRISQFAALIHKSENLLPKLMETSSLGELQSFFDVKASPYWEEHFNFDKSSKKRAKPLGKSAINTLILNSVVQFLFFYAEVKGSQHYRDQAVSFMLGLAPESNHIINKWAAIGVKASSALESQALIELRNNYCKRKKCLSCNIGTKLLRQTAN